MSNIDFKVVNDSGVVVMHTTQLSCIPDQDTLSAMYQGGYRFLLNGKKTTLKSLKELQRE